MRRTSVAVALVALLAFVSCSSSKSTGRRQGPPSTASSKGGGTLAERAADAYVWGYPLVVTERTLASLARLAPENHLTFQPKRSDVSTRTVVAPNTDTLYAVAPLDLRAQPYVLRLPAITDRYNVFQFLSAYTDSFAYVGTRATGGRAGSWVIVPPGWHGTIPAGYSRINSPTPQLLLLARFRVVDDADVAKVHEIGQHITFEPLSTVTGSPAPAPTPPFGEPAGTAQNVAQAGAGFFDELGDALAINPPTDPQELATMRSFASLGIGPGKHPTSEVHDPTLQAALAQGVTKGQARIDAAAGTKGTIENGWTLPNLHIGTYDHNALLRAVVADVGWGANIPAEAVYVHSTADAAGAPYSGTDRYVIHFLAGDLPPVKAFWSITMYGPDRFFVANPINRYAISGQTPGLKFNADGSLDLYLQHDPPMGHESNWLPTPASGGFYLSLRLYLPEQPILQGTYKYPAIRQLP